MQTFLFQSIKVIKCELIWSVEKICTVHSDFAVFSICNGFEIFIFQFLFFWNDDGSNNLWIRFLDNFFPYPKSQKIIGSRFNWYKVVNVFHAVNDTCQLSDMDTSNFLPLYVLPSLNLEKTGEFLKNYLLFSCIFFYWSLAFRLVLLNACTWSYKVLMQTSRESIFFPKGLQNLSM